MEVKKLNTKTALLLFLMLSASLIATTAVTITIGLPNLSSLCRNPTHAASFHVKPLGDPIDDPFFPTMPK